MFNLEWKNINWAIISSKQKPHKLELIIHKNEYNMWYAFPYETDIVANNDIEMFKCKYTNLVDTGIHLTTFSSLIFYKGTTCSHYLIFIGNICVVSVTSLMLIFGFLFLLIIKSHGLDIGLPWLPKLRPTSSNALSFGRFL
jgi:hypothetical protein